MVKVRCRTNLDKFKFTEFPTELPFRPVIGDVVIVSENTDLEVIAVRFKKDPISNGDWYAEIELHIPKRYLNNKLWTQYVKNEYF